MTTYDWEKIAEDRRRFILGHLDTIIEQKKIIDRLTRIMPHIGETCKCFDYCKVNNCESRGFCQNDKWELKE